MEKIVLSKITNNDYRVYFCSNGEVIDESNGVDLGNFIRDIDGFFYFDPIRKDGYWSSYSMRLVSNKLDELNKPYNDELDEYFKKHGENNTNDSLSVSQD